MQSSMCFSLINEILKSFASRKGASSFLCPVVVNPKVIDGHISVPEDVLFLDFGGYYLYSLHAHL